MRGNDYAMGKVPLALAGIVCLCLAVAGQVQGFPLNLGNLEEEQLGKQREAEIVIEDLELPYEVDEDAIVRIGTGFTVQRGEIIEDDVIVIGGGLTVEGEIVGDAVVIGGSMYLGDDSYIDGDAVVIGGMLEMEDGARVTGEVVENPEAQLAHDMHMKIQHDLQEDLEDMHEDMEEMHEKKSTMHDLKIETSGDIVRFGKPIVVDVDQVVEGDVVAIGSSIRILGTVDGDVVTTAGGITLESSAKVKGDVVATFGDITIEEGAITHGEVVEIGMSGPNIIRSEPVTRKPVPGKTTYLISLHRPDADEVRLTGSWVDWDPEGIRMDRDEKGTWKTTVSLKPGSYKYKFIVDGEWIADPDMDEVVPDGRGGEATPLHVKGDFVTSPDVGEEKVTIIFSLDRPDLYDVRVTGTFNDWDPDGIRMKQDDDGNWSVAVNMKPGTQVYKFYLDGEWMPDPDVDEVVSDRMGGKATMFFAKPRDKDLVPIRFTLKRPGLYDVRVTGDFNDWDYEGIYMWERKDGTWEAMVPLAPGVYKYKFYVNDDWVPDPDVEETVPDGRGGKATEFKVKSPTREVRTVFDGMDVYRPKGNDFSPTMDYTRVDGLTLGAVLQNRTNLFPIPRFYLQGDYSWKRDRWMYEFSLEQPVIGPFFLTVGGSIYDKTDTFDGELVTDGENFLTAAFLKREYRDYFDRRGATGFVAIHPYCVLDPRSMKSPSGHEGEHMLKFYYLADVYRPLETRAHTALFRKDAEFARNPRNPETIQIGFDEDGDLSADKIEVTAMGGEYELDTRDCNKTTDSGVWIRLGGEWARRTWGGDLEYDRWTGDVRHYHRISPKQKVAFRVKAGVLDLIDEDSCASVPGVEYFFPKQFYVGGVGTLPGYGFKQFQGTHMLLANVEYQLGMNDDISLLFFSDFGDALGIGHATRGDWAFWDTWEDMKLQVDAGVGLRHEDQGDHTFTLGVVRGLTDLHEEDDRPVIFFVRASRVF
jgi:cytoskeletal protein CcmA (bactofilin family)